MSGVEFLGTLIVTLCFTYYFARFILIGAKYEKLFSIPCLFMVIASSIMITKNGENVTNLDRGVVISSLILDLIVLEAIFFKVNLLWKKIALYVLNFLLCFLVTALFSIVNMWLFWIVKIAIMVLLVVGVLEFTKTDKYLATILVAILFYLLMVFTNAFLTTRVLYDSVEKWFFNFYVVINRMYSLQVLDFNTDTNATALSYLVDFLICRIMDTTLLAVITNNLFKEKRKENESDTISIRLRKRNNIRKV